MKLIPTLGLLVLGALMLCSQSYTPADAFKINRMRHPPAQDSRLRVVNHCSEPIWIQQNNLPLPNKEVTHVFVWFV
jgi:hypothetical protein